MLSFTRFDINNICYFLTFIYLFFSIFEYYINGVVGNIVRYFMLFYTIIIAARFVYLKKYLELNKGQFFLLIWFCYSILTCLWSSSTDNIFRYIFTFSTMSIVLIASYSIKFSIFQINKLLWFYQLCSFGLCLLAIFFAAQYGVYADGRNVLAIGDLMMDPNYLLVLYAISLQVGFYYLICVERRGNFWRLFDLFSVLVSIYAIFNTGSRSGLIVVVLSLLILINYKLQDVSIVEKLKYLFILLCGLFLLYVASDFFLDEATVNRVLGRGDLAFYNGTGRLEGWADHLELWNTFGAVLFGMGFGSNTAHSTILTFLFEFGIFGTVFYIFAMCLLVREIVLKSNMLAMSILACGMLQAFLCPATSIRFFWNSMIIPVLLINSMDDEN